MIVKIPRMLIVPLQCLTVSLVPGSLEQQESVDFHQDLHHQLEEARELLLRSPDPYKNRAISRSPFSIPPCSLLGSRVGWMSSRGRHGVFRLPVWDLRVWPARNSSPKWDYRGSPATLYATLAGASSLISASAQACLF